MFRNLSLRARFLVAPLVGIALALLLYFAAASIIRSNSTLLENLSDSNLPQLAQINRLNLGLLEFQARLNIVLNRASVHGDEEKVYLEGRQLLNRLYELEDDFAGVSATLDDAPVSLVAILGDIDRDFARYRDTVISAIELSTLNHHRTVQELTSAELELIGLNQRLLVVADHFVEQMDSANTLIDGSFAKNRWINTFAVGLLALMIFFAIFLSGRMSQGLDEIRRSLLNLSEGKLDVEIPESDDLYLRDQHRALQGFREALIANQQQRSELEDNLERLRDSENRYHNLLDLIATAIIVIDDQQSIVLFNKAAEQIFGYHEGEIIGQHLDRLLPAEAIDHHSQLVQRFRDGKPNYLTNMTRTPIRAQRRNEEIFDAEVSLSKIQLSSETLMIAALTDVTERTRTEAELAEYRRDLEESVEQKSRLATELEFKNAELERFVYTVSHELRSPLVTTKGFVGLLQKNIEAGELDKIMQDLEKISQATDNMGKLLEGLLELSRVGLVVNPPQSGSLKWVVEQAIDQVSDLLDQRGIRVEVDNNLPRFWGDDMRMIEVFQNLLENSAKFMGSQPEPLIRVRASQTDDMIECSVEDNGIGIDPQYHHRIFNLFERLDQEIEGTGIGMSLVQRIVAAHGGDIRVESDGDNRGCRIVFTIPADPPSIQAVDDLSKGSSSG